MKGHVSLLSLVLLAAPVVLAQTMTDQQFVDDAAQGNMMEAHLGKVAQEKGASEAVKQFGQKLESDHKAAYDKLSAAASPGFTVPKGIDAKHQALIRRVEVLTGKTFDRQFQQRMIEDHQKDIAKYQKASTSLQNPQLRDYASQTLPVLRSHLQMARDLNKKPTPVSERKGTPRRDRGL